MTFILRIDLDNAAFDNAHGDELVRILQGVIQDVRYESDDRLIRLSPAGVHDSNGNRVGQWEIR